MGASQYFCPPEHGCFPRWPCWEHPGLAAGDRSRTGASSAPEHGAVPTVGLSACTQRPSCSSGAVLGLAAPLPPLNRTPLGWCEPPLPEPQTPLCSCCRAGSLSLRPARGREHRNGAAPVRPQRAESHGAASRSPPNLIPGGSLPAPSHPGTSQGGVSRARSCRGAAVRGAGPRAQRGSALPFPRPNAALAPPPRGSAGPTEPR